MKSFTKYFVALFIIALVTGCDVPDWIKDIVGGIPDKPDVPEQPVPDEPEPQPQPDPDDWRYFEAPTTSTILTT